MSTEPNVRSDTRLPDVQLPPGHIWQHERMLGEGGEGTAHLWLHLDADQRVVERIVIKNTVHVDPDRHIIKDGPHEGEWLEVYVQQRLAPSGSTDFYTVPVLAAQKIPGSTYGWRTYMPYYSKGDFQRIMTKAYRQFPVPEPFLWFVFHRMAKAAVAMDETFRDEGRDRPVLVHQDIKPENIFMGHPGSLGRDEPYPVYPVAYLGDFGASYLTADDESWRGKLMGTLGYCAPEQDTGIPPRPRARYDVPLGSKTNIWGFGNCMLLAMTGDRGSGRGTDGTKFGYHSRWDYLRELDPEEPYYWPGYSDDLIKTVEWCLKDTMENRPTPQELLEQIERLMPQHNEGMDRWGTFSWVKDKSREVDGPLASADVGRVEDTDADAGVMPGEKRKTSSSAGSPRQAKRNKAQTALDRRLEYVATIIQGRLPKPHDDDHAFVLGWKNSLVYASMDEEFKPELFFDTVGPEPISFFKVDAVAADRDIKGKAKATSASSKDNEDVGAESYTNQTGASKPGSKAGKEKETSAAPIDEEYGGDDYEEGFDFAAGGIGTYGGDDDGEDEYDNGFYAGGGGDGTFGDDDDDEEDMSQYKKLEPSKIDKGKGRAVDAAPSAAPPVTPSGAKTPKAAATSRGYIDLATPTPAKPENLKGAGTAKSPFTFESPTPVKKRRPASGSRLVYPPVTPPPAARVKGTRSAPMTVGDTPAPADDDEFRHLSSPLSGKGKKAN